MRVKELIEMLKMEDQDAEVHFQYNYGDHWRTQVAPEVRSVYEGFVVNSDYHRMPKVLEDEEDIYLEDGEQDPDVQRVILIG